MTLIDIYRSFLQDLKIALSLKNRMK